MTTEQLADKFIKELQAEGYTPEQMIEVFRKAKIKFDLNYRKVYLAKGISDYMDYDGVVKRSNLFDHERQSFYFYTKKNQLEDINPIIDTRIVPNQIFNTTMSIQKKLFHQLQNTLEEHILEALKLKGYEFNNRVELETFIKQHCRIEDNIHYKERTYFVKEVPFFIHLYDIKTDFTPKHTDKGITISASLGSYAYL